MKAELRGAPKIVHAPGHSFSDVAAKCVHIVNLASVRELERIIGRPVDPLRFRANLYLDGMEPWAEFAWLDKEIGVGPTRLRVFARTQRCEATNVDPEHRRARHGDPRAPDADLGTPGFRRLRQGRDRRRDRRRRAGRRAAADPARSAQSPS